MRQSDGSEILGPDDPRNLVIGIIHVSPSDERQSVVNAITSQDKQGRDQIVLVLPTQNKSFKSAVDFAGLHQMAGELEATMVLVAPKKSKIANLARKESFTVYSSLEELTAEEFTPPEAESAPAADDELEHTMMFPLELPGAPILAPAAPVEQEAEASSGASSPGEAPEEEEEEEPTSPALAIPPVAPEEKPTGSSAAIPPVAPEEEEEEEEPTSPALPAVAAIPPAVPPQVDLEEEEPTNPSLPVPELADLQTANEQEDVARPSGYLPAVMPANTGVLVSSPPQLPAYYEPGAGPHHRSWRGLIIAAITIVVLLGLGLLFYRPVLDLFFPPTATVTIVPGSQRLQHTYQITAVLGVPDPTKNQVDARALYADSQMQMQTVKATGQGHLAGQQAHGALTFYNTSTNPQTIAAGTIVFDASGLAVVNEQNVTLPALNTTTGLTGTTVTAHTVNAGSEQNIPANDFNSTSCCNGMVYVTNAQPFTGGQDQQTFTYVQQSDIDGVVQSMSAVQAQQSTTALQGQVRANEKPAGSPHCAPQVRSNHQAGERADQVTVSVITSCVGEVYDMQAVQVLAARNLTQNAASNPGPAYVPVGGISAQIAQATPDAHGTILLVTNAAGVWTYQFTNAQRAHFASLIAGKNQQDARSILLRQTGVQDVTITLTGVGVANVPTGTGRITITIEAVQGLHS